MMLMSMDVQGNLCLVVPQDNVRGKSNRLVEHPHPCDGTMTQAVSLPGGMRNAIKVIAASTLFDSLELLITPGRLKRGGGPVLLMMYPGSTISLMRPWFPCHHSQVMRYQSSPFLSQRMCLICLWSRLWYALVKRMRWDCHRYE